MTLTTPDMHSGGPQFAPDIFRCC